MKARPCWLYEPTTAATPSLTALRAQVAAPVAVLPSLQVITRSSCPARPPWLLVQRAYASAIAGMPGMLVALVSWGAQVITVMGSWNPRGPGESAAAGEEGRRGESRRGPGSEEGGKASPAVTGHGNAHFLFAGNTGVSVVQQSVTLR